MILICFYIKKTRMVAKKKTEICCSVHTGELFKTITILLIQMASLSEL